MLLNRIIWWSFAGVVVGVPLVFLPDVFLMYELPKVALFRSLVLIIWLFLVMKIFAERKVVWMKINWKLWVLGGGFVLMFVLGTIFSLSPHVSFWGSYHRQQGLLQFIFYILFFLSVIVFFDRYGVERLTRWICYGAFIVSVIAIFQKLFVIRVYGTLGQPNFLANYLLIVLPFIFINLKKKTYWVFLFVVLFAFCFETCI